ncbi:MAG TPA: tetratricopeptide repeat protein [Thermomicrobiaceae bacterium]|nr:tetratricopeptide repeat protein [Thermomicrobiaceae bacterium]
MSRPLFRLISAAALLLTVAAVLLSRRALGGSRPPVAVQPMAVPTTPVKLASPIATSPTSAVTLGEQFERDGDYTDALSQLEPYVGHGSPSSDAQVRFVLARVLLESGRMSNAVSVVDALRATYPQSPEADLAQFILAESQQQLGNYNAAILAYRAFGTRHPELASYVQLQIVSVLQAEGQLDQAQSLANSQVTSAPIPAVRLDALGAVRAIQTLKGDFHGYLATTNRLLGVATDPALRAQLTYERGWAEQAIQDPKDAINDYRTVVVTAPTSSFARQALTGLSQLNASHAVTLEQQGIVLYDNGQYQAAIAEFTSAIQANPRSDVAWYYRALSRLKNGDDTGAEADFQGISQGFPNSQYAPDALYRAGRLQEDAGQPNAAQATYQSLVDHYPTAADAPDARFRLGFLQYLKRDYAAAEKAWSPNGLAGSNASRADFWLGKARNATGDTAGARSAFMAAAATDPGGYYGLRAGDLLAGDATASISDPATPVPGPTSSVLPATPLASPVPDASLATWFRAQGTDQASALAAMQRDPGYRRASLLLDLGLRSQATDELSALTTRDANRPAALASLASLLTTRGNLRLAYPIGEKAITASVAQSLGIPPQIEALAYPTPYATEIATSSTARGVDPLLLLALMRQESSYVPGAQSPAGALGLTQVMPDTGRSIAAAIGDPSFQPGDLLKPAVSIDFGAYYLAQQLAYYHGALFPAIAAYNAGTGAVDGWLKTPAAKDPDVFAELIPYPETHDYLQIVYANYLSYEHAYRAGKP